MEMTGLALINYGLQLVVKIAQSRHPTKTAEQLFWKYELVGDGAKEILKKLKGGGANFAELAPWGSEVVSRQATKLMAGWRSPQNWKEEMPFAEPLAGTSQPWDSEVVSRQATKMMAGRRFPQNCKLFLY